MRHRIVRRPNFGVTFSYQQQIFVHLENYVHHLVFDLPDQNQAVLRQFQAMANNWDALARNSKGPLTFPFAFAKQ